eukprot:3279637-Heterocapsa_arctica.AAC.1
MSTTSDIRALLHRTPIKHHAPASEVHNGVGTTHWSMYRAELPLRPSKQVVVTIPRRRCVRA